MNRFRWKSARRESVRRHLESDRSDRSRVTKTGQQTVLGRVKEIVEEAQQTRAPIVRLTEEYARYYMPLILLIAGFILFFTKDVHARYR